ncbi:MAG: RNA pseudouridine synthase [Candidatus Accumulibacter sp.]|uniref:pseudouridine synthase n=1 Tax=Accumulibacter sp. TaxID=2053492 RepID=UPI002878D3E5|nr:RNA pseudouridine synthase [Accumulibacter sp.]MDS4013304.1 RNA pseudouridine synthase [Accumulibacter sp.]
MLASGGKEAPRLAKLVCRLALCSRREADEWIENGWVSVDGKVVARLGARVHPNARIEINPVAGQQRSEAITIVFHQVPRTPSADELDERVPPGEIIRADNHWSEDRALRRLAPTHLRGLALAGRLAPDECGMLVFTQDGNTARQLTGRASRWEKEYHVRFLGELDDQGLDRLRHGLTVDGVKLPRIRVSRLSEQQLRFVVHDNSRRQIQRMCELLALPLGEIRRVRIGSVPLGRLPPGKWRYLRGDERF